MMTSISRSLLPCTLALALAACGTSDDTSTATNAGTGTTTTDVGTTTDATTMQDGDTVKRMFQTKTDADLFHIEFAVAGTYLIAATPDLDDDIRLEFYNADASELGFSDNGGAGEPEGGEIMTQPGLLYVVVRNIGNSNGSFTITVTKQ